MLEEMPAGVADDWMAYFLLVDEDRQRSELGAEASAAAASMNL